jgi:CPA2 family monovalent cation:H+ antiporter-2
MHDLSVIVLLAGALAVALVFGWITQRLGLSTLVGYMLAGIVVGPHTPGFVADARLATQMAEIGVILLMFGVGMHFHPQELLRVWRIAVPGAVGQSAVALVAGWAAARSFGWSHAAGIVFGMALAVASTVVLMRMLVERDRLSTRAGHVAVGWLIVEDLFTVIALVVLPALSVTSNGSAQGVGANAGGALHAAREIALALAKAGIFALLVWLVGTRVVTATMERIARTRSGELFTLTVFVLALGVAILAAEVFHVSVALGAFFAGLVVGQSRFGPQAAADTASFRDVFSALFFVSVGMLFDPAIILTDWGKLLAGLAIVLLAKPAVAWIIVRLLREPAATGLTVAVGLSQIGEFSFILAALGRSLNVLPATAFNVLVGVAIVSIALNPLLFRWLPNLERRLGGRHPEHDRNGDTQPAAPEAEHAATVRAVVVTGVGEQSRRYVDRCIDAGVPVSVLSQDLDALDGLRARGVHTVFGDPARREVLANVGAADARVVAVVEGTLAEKMQVCMAVREVSNRAVLVTVAASGAERAWLEEFGAALVCDAMDEIGESLMRATRKAM